MGGTEAVRDVVVAFVDDVTAALEAATEAVADTKRHRFRGDVVNEAFNLAVAFVDADERHTDNELWALTTVFGPMLPDSDLVRATPATLRGSTLIAGKRSWIDR